MTDVGLLWKCYETDAGGVPKLYMSAAASGRGFAAWQMSVAGQL